MCVWLENVRSPQDPEDGRVSLGREWEVCVLGEREEEGGVDESIRTGCEA